MKRFIKLAIGALTFGYWHWFSPRRLAAVQDQFFASHSLTLLERQVLAFMLRRTHAAAASCHWAGRAGSRFHEHPHHRLTLDVVAADNLYRRPMLDDFAQRAAMVLRPGASIVEVGCGAGGNLLYLHGKLAGQGFSFHGFDINETVIASNRRHNYAGMTFEVRNCFDSQLAVPGDLGLICCAVLMYAQEAQIEQFLRRVIDNNHGRILLGISEPTLDPEASSAGAGDSLGVLHGYGRILRKLNFHPLFASLRPQEGKQVNIYHAVYEFPR